MAFGFNRNLGVVLTADTKSLERGLDRANAKVAAFGKSVGAAKGGLGNALIGGKGAAAFLGGGAAAIGFQKIINAAKESEVVLGQTQVAVDALGLSYANNADLIISKSDEISRSSAFDDEEVLKAFGALVRTTKDVPRALELAGLAADVARGRYISLESATSLVTKAALGNVGALRRVGIQIDKTASATEALEALQRSYGGSAVKYANSAAGAQDRLNVAVENVAESLGSSLTPAIVEMSNELVEGIDGATNLAAALKNLANSGPIRVAIDVVANDVPFGGKAFELLQKSWKLNPANPLFLAELGKQFPRANSSSDAGGWLTSAPGGPAGGAGGQVAAAANRKPIISGALSRLQRLQLDATRAAGTDYLADDLKAAQALVTYYKGDAKGKRGDELFKTQDALIQAENDVAALQREIAARTTADARAQKDKLRAAADRARQARQDFADKLASAAKDLTDARIQRLDLVQSGRDAARRIRDARENLQKQLRIGGTVGIRTAREELQDAQLERRRLQLQGITFAGNGTTIGNVKIEINSNQDPVKIADEVLARLKKKANQTSTQTRGRRPAVFYGGA